MEDNELGLEYGINFNVKKGGEQATKEIQDYNTRWEEWLKKNPLKIHFDVVEGGSTEEMKERTRKTTENITGLKSEIADLEKQWAKLNATQRKSAEGQRILSEYKNTVQSAGMYSGTLASVQAAQQRAQTASARSAAKEQEKSQKQALQMEKELQTAKTQTINTTSKLSDAYRNQGNIISNLKGLASQYISIYAAGRLVQNLTEITGMFELQEKSLEAIIRNKQQADRIFSQTKTLAVESPFQFKDLIGYVKQLAAYRVETDQLYDTMKNLADVLAYVTF